MDYQKQNHLLLHDIDVKLVKDDGAGKFADPVCYQSIQWYGVCFMQLLVQDLT